MGQAVLPQGRRLIKGCFQDTHLRHHSWPQPLATCTAWRSPPPFQLRHRVPPVSRSDDSGHGAGFACWQPRPATPPTSTAGCWRFAWHPLALGIKCVCAYVHLDVVAYKCTFALLSLSPLRPLYRCACVNVRVAVSDFCLLASCPAALARAGCPELVWHVFQSAVELRPGCFNRRYSNRALQDRHAPWRWRRAIYFR